MPIISVFNNKGGVGKTTYMYHIAHVLAKKGKRILLVDLDSQCNLSAYCLSFSKLESEWNIDGSSIWNIVLPVATGMGDFKRCNPIQFSKYYKNIFLVPGDIAFSNFEDQLGDTWTRARGGDERSIRVQTAIYRYIKWAISEFNIDITMLDLGPNLGSINRCALASSDFFIVPMAPDLFSIRGSENLGNKLLLWGNEWSQCSSIWKDKTIEIPSARPVFIGYITQKYNIRSRSKDGMTKGWGEFNSKIDCTIMKFIVEKLESTNQIYNWEDGKWKLGQIPNLNSLIPYSQKVRKPVFDCGSRDGLTGAHISRARQSINIFEPIANKIIMVCPNN